MAVGENGMICTSHPAASMAGLDMLRSGGNAVDAALAAIAVLAVVEPHMTGIGGDCFALFSMGGAAPIALDGSGRAPGAAKAEWYVDRDIREIPPTSAHAVTIPGAISAWCTLNRDHGSKPLSEVLAPAIRLAEEGMRVTPRVAWDWGRQIENCGRARTPVTTTFQFASIIMGFATLKMSRLLGRGTSSLSATRSRSAGA
jgi:gamma-glutamyltranspeptidase/glutathione hydrolase